MQLKAEIPVKQGISWDDARNKNNLRWPLISLEQTWLLKIDFNFFSFKIFKS